jgi:hypothetical protein
MAFMLKQRIALSASKEYILVNYISVKGYYEQPVRQLLGYKIKINKILMFDHKEPPKEYHLRINDKIVPYNDLDKILDKKAGDVNNFAMIFENTIGVEPEAKSKFVFRLKNTRLMGKLMVQPLEEPITIPESSEIVMDVSVGEVEGAGLANVPLPAVPIEVKEQNAAILRQAYDDFLAGNYPFEKIRTEEDIERAYNNKKIFVIEKDKLHMKGVVVIGHEGLFIIKRGTEYYYPWSEIKQVHWGWITHGFGLSHPAKRFTVKIHDWNDKKVLYFTPGKYSQKEFKVKLLVAGPAALKSARIFESLFQKYWKPKTFSY